MKKKIFVLLILLLLTGCKAKYNLQINFGGNIIETGAIYFNSNLLGKGNYPSDYKEFLKKASEDYYFSSINKKIPFNSDNYFGYNFYKRYHNVNYYSQSPAILALFNGLSVTKNDHYIKWQTNGNNKIADYHNLTADIPTIVEGIEINISLPFKVVKHNASSFNATTNTYTWTFNGNTNAAKGINLEYYDNEIFTYDPIYLFKFVSPYVYITIVLVIIVLIIISTVKSRARYRNRI